MVVVDYFATWCAACKAMAPKVSEFVGEHPEIVLAKIKFDDQKILCKAMGVKALPFFQIYRGTAGKTEQLTASLKKFPLLEEAVEKAVSMTTEPGQPKGAEEFAAFQPRPKEMRNYNLSG